MRRSIALAAAILVVALVAPAQAAPGNTIVDVDDPKHDVKISPNDGPPNTSQRRSIDIRRLVIKDRADSTRFLVTINRFTVSAKFDQIVEIRLLPPVGSDETWQAEIRFSPQKPKESSSYFFDENEAWVCKSARSVKYVRTVTVRLDESDDCIPEGAARIELATYTRSSHAGYSRDRLNPPGTYVLR